MKFCKIQATGNDFIIIDSPVINKEVSPVLLARKLCDRHFSVGGDGLITVSFLDGMPSIKFYNPDGTVGEMCGNGARCVAAYLFHKNPECNRLSFMTDIGEIECKRMSGCNYCVKINNIFAEQNDMSIDADSLNIIGRYIEVGESGVPHFVVFSRGLYSLGDTDLLRVARSLRNHSAFKKGANISVCCYSGDKKVIYVKTYERGVEDFTLSCGTAACAVATCDFINNPGRSSSVLSFPGGRLNVKIAAHLGLYDAVLSGPASITFKGNIYDQNAIE